MNFSDKKIAFPAMIEEFTFIHIRKLTYTTLRNNTDQTNFNKIMNKSWRTVKILKRSHEPKGNIFF